MTTGLVFGAVIGVGLWVLSRGISPDRPGLDRELARLRRPGRTDGTGAPGAASGAARRAGLEQLALALAEGLGVDLGLRRQDLAVTGRGAGDLAVSKLLAAVSLAALPVASWLLVVLLGGWFSPALAAGAAGLGAVAGWIVPELRLREAARARRGEFVAALALYLDLVAISLAGGNGAQTALRQAASIGDSWPFRRLRSALARAELANRSPWTELGALADEIGVAELAELTGSMELAGTTGARVRSSLAAKARSTRARQLAAIETEAQEASERMSMPLVLMLSGFVVFVGYPALHAVLQI